ncbi:MAG: PAS domain S-box protein, partial [Planctomycetota bacterium]
IKRTKQPVTVEHIHYNENGEPCYVEVHAYPIFDSQGNVSQIIEHTIDISERKKAQERILKERRFSGNLINSSIDGIFAYDTDCCCTLWNPAMERITGISREQILGKCLFDIVGFLKDTGDDKLLLEALAGRAVVARDRLYTIPETGRQGFFEGYYGPLHDTQGQIMGGLAIVRDITATKRAEEEVRNSKLLYQNLVETSHDLVFQCSREGKYVFLNKAWESTIGYRIDEMLGRDFSDFKRPEIAARDMEVFARLLEGQSVVGYETTYITRSGEERHLLFNEVPRHDASGEVIGTQGTAFDITERKQTEQALESLNAELATAVERLTAANRELGDFAHITAHDLKTPLRGIGSLAGIIGAEYRDCLDDQGRQLLEMLVGRANRMYEQIDGILAYSEIGRLDEKKEHVNLNELVKEVITTIDPPAYVEIFVESDLPSLVCNKIRMAQVFQNLLDNAIKYIDKPEGRILVGCVQEDGFWKFSVTDNGCGIEERYFGKIFQIFQTLRRRDEVESTGIGLSVVKKIVEKYNGKVWVESKAGEETTFFFTLPMQEMGVQSEEFKANTAG